MNADSFPTEIIVILLIEFLFGLFYNSVVDWAHKHEIMHVSTSVVVGVLVTLIIPVAAFWHDEFYFWQTGILLAACFTASGIPMIVGSTRRTVVEKDNKKRRAWPTAANRAREDAVMELSAMAEDIARQAKDGRLTVSDLPSVVSRLYQVIGTLKSV